MTFKLLEDKVIILENRIADLESQAAVLIRNQRYIPKNDEPQEIDSLLEDAWEAVRINNNASASFLQRKLKIGYARSARLLDQLESKGLVGPSNGAIGREVFVNKNFAEQERA